MDSSDPQEGLPPKARALALTAMAVALVLVMSGAHVVVVALPTMADHFNVTASEIIWVVAIYQVAATVSLLPLASLGEIVGHRNIYAAGLGLFAIASLACTFAPDLSALIFARAVQGVAAAGVMSVNIALIRFIYPTRLIGRGVSFAALVSSTASALGFPVASSILSVFSWQALFALNFPIGLFALFIALKTLPQTPRMPRRFDFIGAALSALTFGLLIMGLEGLGHDAGRIESALLLAGSVLTGSFLVRRLTTHPAPILPLDLFKIPAFSLSVASSICCFAAQSLAFVSLPFFFQSMLGYPAIAAGYLMSPWPVAAAIVAPISGRLSDRLPAGPMGFVGLLIYASGFALLAALPWSKAPWFIGGCLMLCGAGFAIFQSPNNRMLIMSAPPERAGGASGMQSTARLVGQTIGSAAAGAAFSLFGQRSVMVCLLLAAVLAVTASATSVLRR